MDEDLQWKTTFDGGHPLMEDNLRWKTTFDTRQPMMDDDLWWKTNWWKMTLDGRQTKLWLKTTIEGRHHLKTTAFEGRQPLKEEKFLCKMTFDGRCLLLEEHYWWKMTIDRRQPLIEGILWWTTDFDERQPLMEDDLWWKRTFWTRTATPTLIGFDIIEITLVWNEKEKVLKKCDGLGEAKNYISKCTIVVPPLIRNCKYKWSLICIFLASLCTS